MQLRVAEDYLERFGNLAKEGNTLIVPANLSDVSSMIGAATNVLASLATAGWNDDRLAAYALERHIGLIKTRYAGRAGWAKRRAWAGVKHGAREASTGFMALDLFHVHRLAGVRRFVQGENRRHIA